MLERWTFSSLVYVLHVERRDDYDGSVEENQAAPLDTPLTTSKNKPIFDLPRNPAQPVSSMRRSNAALVVFRGELESCYGSEPGRSYHAGRVSRTGSEGQFQERVLRRADVCDGRRKLTHNQIASNALVAVGRRLAERCIALNSDQRVGIGKGRAYVYPDITVVCGKREIAGIDDILLNPVIVIEVLSESTEVHDRGYTWSLYRELESLREYVLMWQTQPRIEVYRRESGRWVFDESKGLDAVCRFESVELDAPLSEVYRGLEFPSDTE